MRPRTMARRNLFLFSVASALLSAGISYLSYFDSNAKAVVAFLAVFTSLFLARVVYIFVSRPLDFGGHEGKDSYLLKKKPRGMTKEEAISQIKSSRSVGDVPPVYPNGWFALMLSDELKEREVKYVHALGLQLAVFRGESGKAYIMDAYCRHLGANLAFGGKVTGECIECPFHGWRYNGSDGKCVKVGYSDKVPDFVSLSTHRCVEANGFVMVWFHAEEEDPSWFPPEVEALKTDYYRVGSYVCYLDCHIQDIMENAWDAPHLDYLHGPQIFQKHFTGSFEVHPTEKYRSVNYQQMHSDVSLLMKKPKETLVEQNGPGLTYVTQEDGYAFVHMLPVGPLKQKILYTFFAPKSTGFFGHLFFMLQLYIASLVLEGDLPVWSNKTYMTKPNFLKEDQPIAQHRRWFSQFYTENSPRYHAADPLSW